MTTNEMVNIVTTAAKAIESIAPTFLFIPDTEKYNVSVEVNDQKKEEHKSETKKDETVKEETKKHETKESATTKEETKSSKVVDFEDKKKEAKKKGDPMKVDISKDLYNACIKLAKENKITEKNLIKRAMNTEKWIRYALYIAYNPDGQILPADLLTKQFVNFITSSLGKNKVYDVKDLENPERFDYCNYDVSKNGSIIYDKKDLDKRIKTLKKDEEQKSSLNLPGVPTNKSKIIYTEVKDGKAVEVGSDTVEKDPIRFMSDEEKKEDIMDDKKGNVPADILVRFEYAVSKFLPNTTKYCYRLIENFFYLIVRRENADEYYLIDDGSICGGEQVRVLSSYTDADGSDKFIFVNIYDQAAIAGKMFKSVFYKLNQEELNKVLLDAFNSYPDIYNQYDLENTKFIDDLTPDQKMIFLRNLEFIRTMIPNVRLRFLEFTDISHFTLISDNNTNPALVNMIPKGVETPEIVEGFKVTLDGFDVMQEYYGEVKWFHMNMGQ